MNQSKYIPYICVLDFEATCEDKKNFPHEIIEFPSVLLKWNEKVGNYEPISEFQEYCRPLDKDRVSKFCYELTGITQETVNAGKNFPQTLGRHLAWLRENVPEYAEGRSWRGYCPVIILTCGHWDLKEMLPNECARWQITVSEVYRNYLNIKEMYEDFYNVKRMGMAKMLQHSKLKLLGRHHSGIDDCRNTARLVQKMVDDGYKWQGIKWINKIESGTYKHKKEEKRTQRIRARLNN